MSFQTEIRMDLERETRTGGAPYAEKPYLRAVPNLPLMVLRTFRMRWQIEMAFKRLKSIAQLGHVPERDDHSARAWLYGKLLVTLLAQKLIRIGRNISLSDYAPSALGTA